MSSYEKILHEIQPVQASPMLEKKIASHLGSLTKPLGSLGALEEIVARVCRIQQSSTPRASKKVIAVFAADHGIAEEGVSAYPAEVTAQMVTNMLTGGAAINVLSRHARIENYIIDVGVKLSMAFLPAPDSTNLKFINNKVAMGSNNFLYSPAMSEADVMSALDVGISLAHRISDEGASIVAAGEMGIGNTSSASAIFAALLMLPARAVTGCGTGIDARALERKISVIQAALDFHQKNLTSPLEVLRCMGGLEIAAICGFFLASSARRMVIVVDGFISSAAALVAMRLNPFVKDYLFFSHVSAEAGHKEFLQREKITPLLDFGMRLGEGTGAALAIPIIEASVKIYNQMATFSSAGVSTK